MACCPIGCAVPRPACATRSPGGRIQHTTWTGQPLDPACVAPLPLFQRLELTVLADLLSGTSVARMPARTGLFAATICSGTLFARLAHGIDSPHIPDV